MIPNHFQGNLPPQRNSTMLQHQEQPHTKQFQAKKSPQAYLDDVLIRGEVALSQLAQECALLLLLHRRRGGVGRGSEALPSGWPVQELLYLCDIKNHTYTKYINALCRCLV